jgi:hypothetical protein
VRKVTDGAGSFGTRRILMPQAAADGQEQNSQRSGAKARKMDPITTLSLSASHHSPRTAGNARQES